MPTQENPFSNDQARFIAEYAGLMRRIPQASALQGGPLDVSQPTRLFLDVFILKILILRKVARLGHVWFIVGTLDETFWKGWGQVARHLLSSFV